MTIPNIKGDLCNTSNPDFKEFRYKEHVPVCNRNVSSATKKKVCDRDGVKDRSNYLVDHFYSLSMGGSNEITNLWCQPRSVNTANMELDLFQNLRDNRMTQEEVLNKLFTTKTKLIERLNSGSTN
jgi:hypothetical protein